ncbi:large ribosomal subunit protein uL24m [Cylas formicarius]|uniref:large ribosomal subunit protein uL24m n=1 Tax=Cylas formicarius TaxID=197179 RepID=UPI002958A901|nr:large ribosomal subunit protein uL24m [Cylas formicarius]
MRLTNSLLSRIGYWSKKYANLPDRYIERAMEQVYWKNPKGIQYKPNAVIKRKKFNFTTNRPWTAAFRDENQGVPRKVFVEPIKNWSWFRGDRVEILVGKDKGKQGYVRDIFQERNWVIVEGLNCKLKQMGDTEELSGVWIQEEQPLLVTTDISLVDPSDLAPTGIEWRFMEDGTRVRVSTRTGRIIPMPKAAEETIDYKTKNTYKEQPKDTTKDNAIEITFQPKLCTFEMDIMEKMGIKEDRVPAKTYWY